MQRWRSSAQLTCCSCVGVPSSAHVMAGLLGLGARGECSAHAAMFRRASAQQHAAAAEMPRKQAHRHSVHARMHEVSCTRAVPNTPVYLLVHQHHIKQQHRRAKIPNALLVIIRCCHRLAQAAMYTYACAATAAPVASLALLPNLAASWLCLALSVAPAACSWVGQPGPAAGLAPLPLQPRTRWGWRMTPPAAVASLCWGLLCVVPPTASHPV
jgi:hypothetical protein